MANRMREDNYEFHSEKEKLCGYKYAILSIPPEYCGLPKKEGRDRCICHLQDDNKDIKRFTEHIRIQQSNQRERYDFEGYFFPKIFDFSIIYPFGQTHNQIINEKRILNEPVNFISCIFNCFTRFSDIDFQKPVNFGIATFNNWSDFCRSNFISSNFNSVTFKDIALFNYTNLKDSSFRDANLEKARFLFASLEKCNLHSAKYSDITKERIYLDDYTKGTNRIFAKKASDFNDLIEKRIELEEKKKKFKKIRLLLFKLQDRISSLARSLFKWFLVCLFTIVIFSFIFKSFYASALIFFSFGLSGIDDKDIVTKLLIIFEIFIGYVMLGVLISIITKKLLGKD